VPEWDVLRRVWFFSTVTVCAAAQNRANREILTRKPPPYDHRIRYGPLPTEFADLRLPAGKGLHPLVIVIHGGFWRAAYDLEHAGSLCAALTGTGAATWNVEYPRIGQQGGGVPGTLQSIGAAADHVAGIAAAHRLDTNRVAVLGHSAGGQLALWLATRKDNRIRLRGAVSLAGVADLRRGWELRLGDGVVQDFLGATPDEKPERYAQANPIERLPAGIPLRLIHGDADPTVPLELSERFEQRARSLGDEAQLIRLPGAGHFELIDPRSGQWRVVEKTVWELLNRHPRQTGGK